MPYEIVAILNVIFGIIGYVLGRKQAETDRRRRLFKKLKKNSRKVSFP